MKPSPGPRRARTGDSRATGRPRFVTRTEAPVVATASISSRHFALNSAAEIVSGGVLARAGLVTMFVTIAPAGLDEAVLRDRIQRYLRANSKAAGFVDEVRVRAELGGKPVAITVTP